MAVKVTIEPAVPPPPPPRTVVIEMSENEARVLVALMLHGVEWGSTAVSNRRLGDLAKAVYHGIVNVGVYPGGGEEAKHTLGISGFCNASRARS